MGDRAILARSRRARRRAGAARAARRVAAGRRGRPRPRRAHGPGPHRPARVSLAVARAPGRNRRPAGDASARARRGRRRRARDRVRRCRISPRPRTCSACAPRARRAARDALAGRSPSPVSHPASATSSAPTGPSTCHGWHRRARGCRAGAVGLAARSRAPIRARRPAGGGSSARPPRGSSIRMPHPPRCWLRARACASGRRATRSVQSSGAVRRRSRLRESRAPQPAVRARAGIRVVEPGLLATLQDLGRPGAASLGVARPARSTAAPRARPTGCSATPRARRRSRRRWAACARSPARPLVRRDGRVGTDPARRPRGRPVRSARWHAGVELHLDWFAHGARAYLAVRGGFDGATVLGSRSTDVLAGTRPARPRAGDVLAVGVRRRRTRSRSPAWRRGERRTTTSSRSSSPRVRGATGSRHPPARALFEAVWTVRTTPTGSACAWTVPRWSVCATASCRARAWCRARCRCRRAGGRRSCSPTDR